MTITITTEKIKKALAAVQSICQKKTISDFTQNILIETEKNELIIKANDLESNIEIYVEINEKDNKQEELVKSFCNGKFIYDIVKEIEEETVTLSFLEEKVVIKSKNSIVEIKTINPENFKENDQLVENILEIKKNKLVNVISFSSPLSVNSIQRNTTASILLEIEKNTIKGTATDGHCLSHIEIKTEESHKEESISFLISKKAASDIKKVLEAMNEKDQKILIGKSDKKIVFSGEKFSIYTKKINDTFPEYKNIISQKDKDKYVCNRSSLMRVAKKLSLFTENKFIPAKGIFRKESIEFSIKNTNMGSVQEEVDAKQTVPGEEITINFFPPYLAKAINEINIEENIEIIIKQKNTPIIVKSENEERTMLYAVMPMKEI
jgi:DNA polymerase-3 subunit beta